MARTSTEHKERVIDELTTPNRPLRKIAEGRFEKTNSPPATETFSYCVGRPWPVSYANPYETNINVYTYFGQVHHGTMAEAEGFRQYVDTKTGEKNQIYKLVPVK